MTLLAGQPGSRAYVRRLRVLLVEGADLIDGHLGHRDGQRPVDPADVGDLVAVVSVLVLGGTHPEGRQGREDGEFMAVGPVLPAEPVGADEPVGPSLAVDGPREGVGTLPSAEEQPGGGMDAGVGVVEIQVPRAARDLGASGGRDRVARLGPGQEQRLVLHGIEVRLAEPIDEDARRHRVGGEAMDQQGAEPRVGAMEQQRPERIGLAQRGQGRRGAGLAGRQVILARLVLGIVDLLAEHRAEELDRLARGGAAVELAEEHPGGHRRGIGDDPGQLEVAVAAPEHVGQGLGGGGLGVGFAVGVAADRGERRQQVRGGRAEQVQPSGERAAMLGQQRLGQRGRRGRRVRAAGEGRLQGPQRAGGPEPRGGIGRLVPEHPAERLGPGLRRVRRQHVPERRDLLGLGLRGGQPIAQGRPQLRRRPVEVEQHLGDLAVVVVGPRVRLQGLEPRAVGVAVRRQLPEVSRQVAVVGLHRMGEHWSACSRARWAATAQASPAAISTVAAARRR